MSEDQHDPVDFVSQLRQILSADKLPIGFFLGAGCPMGIKVLEGESSKPLIPDIKGLTKCVRDVVSASQDGSKPFATLIRTFSEDGVADPTVEDILNRIRAFADVAGKAGVRGLQTEELVLLDRMVCATIRDAVEKPLPPGETPYHALADFFRINREIVTEVFTTNYDILLETALEHQRAPFFDGFVGSVKPFFDQRAIEYNETARRWTRIWKIHGSVNWRIDRSTNAVFRSYERDDGAELLIHPSRMKYDESRRMPYLVMMDRLRMFLRQDRPVALIICGYSFRDEHINNALVEGLQSNPSAVCFALQYGNLDQYGTAISLARSNANLAIFAEDRAVFRGDEGPWAPHPAVGHGQLAIAFDARTITSATPKGDPTVQPMLRLGDFESMGEFLRQFVSLGRGDKQP